MSRADAAFEAEAVNVGFVKAKPTQTRVVASRIGPSTGFATNMAKAKLSSQSLNDPACQSQ